MIKRMLQWIWLAVQFPISMLQWLYHCVRDWNKPVLVQFADGQYGIRKYGIVGYLYYDLKSDRTIWWNRERAGIWFRDCKGTKERCEQVMNSWKEKKLERHRTKKDAGTIVTN